jgi:penicillin-binding protein 1B
MRKVIWSSALALCFLTLACQLAMDWGARLVLSADDIRVGRQPRILSQSADTNGSQVLAMRSAAEGLWAPTEVALDSNIAKCVIAVEDPEFFDHQGVRIPHTFGAALVSFLRRRRVRGASVIDQQIVKNLLLRNSERSIFRKLKELPVAIALDAHYDKHELFSTYASTVPMGSVEGVPITGLQAASRVFFGKQSLDSLTLSEAATLAGMIRSPSSYLEAVKRGQYSALRERRNFVLRRLEETNPTVPKEAIAGAHSESIVLNASRLSAAERCILHAVTIMRAAVPIPDSENDFRSTVSLSLQLEACTVLDQILEHHRSRLAGQDADSLRGSLVVLTGEGEVLAAADDRASQYPYLTSERRAICSTAKPFIAGAALERGWTADSIIDVPAQIRTLHLKWLPAQSGHSCRSDAVTLTYALRTSNNCAFVALGSSLGIERVAEVLQQAFSQRQTAVPSLAIGGATYTSPMAVARAYTVFTDARPGWRAAVRFDASAAGSWTPVIGPAAARRVADMLVTVKDGTAKGLNFPGTPRLKTGSGPADAWLVCVYRDLVIVAWVGSKHGSLPPGWTGANTAGPVVEQFLTRSERALGSRF